MADSFHQPVYVIDFHVDIWNRSGWVDPFSDSINSRRQFNEAQPNICNHEKNPNCNS